jgi:MFS family permease
MRREDEPAAGPPKAKDVTAFVESLPPGALPGPRADTVGAMHESSRTHGERMRGAFPAVIAALMCVHATMSATRVAGSLWLLQNGYPEWTVGTFLSLFAVAPMGLSLWAGRMADRHGLHRPLAISAVLGLSGPLLVLCWLGVAPLIVAALLTGGAVSVAAVAIQHEAGQMARDDQDLKRVFSWVALGPALSNSISPIVAGLLIDHGGYRAAFAFTLVLPLAAWLLGRWVPRHPLGPPAAEAAGAKPRTAFDLLRHAPLRRLLIVNLALSSCWDAHSFAVPVLGHARHLSASAIGLVLGSFSVATTTVRFGISRFGKSLDERRVLRGAMVLAAATSALYVFLPGVAGMMAGSFVLGLALGSVQPMILTMMHQVTPADRRGQALGLRMFCTNAASIPMPSGFGLLAAATFPAAPMWLMASLIGLAMVPAKRIEMRRAAA